MASSRISVRVSSGNCFGIGGGPEALRTPFPRRLACNRRTSGNPGAGRLQKHSGVVRPVRRMSVFSVLSFSPQSFLPQGQVFCSKNTLRREGTDCHFPPPTVRKNLNTYNQIVVLQRITICDNIIHQIAWPLARRRSRKDLHNDDSNWERAQGEEGQALETNNGGSDSITTILLIGRKKLKGKENGR